MPSSKLSALCERIVEAGWLAALVITPLFFNLYSRRSFEADKLLLLRLITSVMAAAWLIRWIEQRSSPCSSTAPTRRNALALPTLLLVGVYCITTLTSIAPRISFFGSYTRLQGTYATLCYVIVFVMLAQGVHSRRQLDRLILTMILTSLPVALYGLIQKYGLDPLWGPLNAAERVSSTMGNPIYMAAYLVMAFFLTLGKVVESLSAIRGDVKTVWLNLLRTTCYILIALAQVAVLVFSSSRGPFLGWLVGLALFALFMALVLRRRTLALGLIGLELIGAALLVALNAPNSPLAGLRQMPYMGRLANWTISPGDSSRVRLLIWEGSANLVLPHEPLQYSDGAPDPLNLIRPLIGYGPESMYLVFGQSFPPALAETGYAGNTLVGRSHNETWDWLVTGGLAGLLAYLFLFFSVSLYGLRSVGLIQTDRERNLFTGLWMGLGLTGALATIILRAPQYLGVVIPAGNLVGLLLYLIRAAMTSHQRDQEPALHRADQILLVALLAGILAHYVEIQFGFAVASTRLMFWAFAGMSVVLGSGRLSEEPASDQAVTPAERAWERPILPASPPWLGSAASYAVIAALLFTPLFYAFIINAEQLADPMRVVWRALTFNSAVNRDSYAMLGLMLLVWALTLIAASTEMARAGLFKIKGLGLLVALSAGLAIAQGLGFARQVALTPTNILVQIGQAVIIADRQASLFDLLALNLFLLILLAALALMADYAHLPAAWFATPWALAALLPVVLVTYLWINAISLNPVRADVIYRRGQIYESHSEWDYAILHYRHAIDLAPNEDVYYRGLGQALLDKASAASDANPAAESLLDDASPLEMVWSLDAQQIVALGCNDSFRAARAVFMQGRAINPLNADHTAGLALVYQRWANSTTDPAQRSRLADQSSQYYAQATRLMPRDTELWNEWAASQNLSRP